MSSNTFRFEADFVDSLRCIPMAVRMKLDIVGIKLSLAQWHQFSSEQRQQLVEMPCGSPTEKNDYRSTLQNWILRETGKPAKELDSTSYPWESNLLPKTVIDQASSLGYKFSQTQWAGLSPLQRFALIKLSRPGHENKNFEPALIEFGLKDDKNS